MKVVVDASVAMKWLVPEVHSAAAARWLDAAGPFLAPDLLFAEAGNVVWKKIGRKEMSREEGREVLAALGAMPLRCHLARDLLEAAFEIALRLRCSVYDATYLALAAGQGCPLVTADRKLHDKVASSPLASHVAWVEQDPAEMRG